MNPSYLAACSLYLSFYCTKDVKEIEWNEKLEFYSLYESSSLIKGCNALAKLVIKSSKSDYKFKAVTNKYRLSLFFCVRLPTLVETLVLFSNNFNLNEV